MLSGMRGQKGEWKWEEVRKKEDVGGYGRKKSYFLILFAPGPGNVHPTLEMEDMSR